MLTCIISLRKSWSGIITKIRINSDDKTYIGKLLHILGPSGAEHESLSVRANLANDFADLGLETHVQHSVSLVHYKIGDSSEVSFLRLQHVDKPSWGSNDDFNTSLKITNLGPLGSTSVDGRVPNARIRTVEKQY